jgi:hypothetical protein
MTFHHRVGMHCPADQIVRPCIFPSRTELLGGGSDRTVTDCRTTLAEFPDTVLKK